MDAKIEEQVKKHIVAYRKQGYSDAKIREALLKSSLDQGTVSYLMDSPKESSKAFYVQWWFIVPVSFLLFFVLLFVYFLIFVA